MDILALAVAFAVMQVVLTCPDVCRCYEARKLVICNNRRLEHIPYGIPRDTEKLLLQENLLTGGQSFETALGALKKLKILNLSGNKLTSFPHNLPAMLREVIIDSNNIKFVGKHSLEKLNLLETLSLKDNNISSELGLSIGAFIGVDNLKTLTLSGNELTSVPKRLPPNLKRLFLNNNKITTIGFGALQNLKLLEDLVISHNMIRNENIDRGSLLKLESLSNLEISHNMLTDIPADLPPFLETLRLSQNRIKYLYAKSSTQHSSLVGLPLKQLDLSSNQLRSVENGALTNINPFIQLQDNPWQCDCHLKYLKSWLNITTAVLTNEGRITCDAPFTLQGVTISSLDMEALICPYMEYRKSIYFTNMEPNSVTVRWRQVAENTPDFVSAVLLYGTLKCQNCTFKIGNEMMGEVEHVIDWVENYNVVELTESHADLPNKVISIKNLQTGIRYVVCASDSSQDVKDIANGQCHVIVTHQKISIETDQGVLSMPKLSIILIAVVSALLVLIIIVVALIIRHYIKAKNEKRILQNRANATPFPSEIIDQVLQRNAPHHQHYPRMGLTVPGQSRANGFEDRDQRRGQTIDGRKEFDVTLVHNGHAHYNAHNSADNIRGLEPHLVAARTDNSDHENMLNDEIARYHDDFYNNQETVPLATYLEKPGSANSTPHSRDTGVFV